MDTMAWIWIVVAIIVVVVIIGVVTALSRKRRRVEAEQQAHEDREKAGQLREHAKVADLDAREKHAAAARTTADAEQAAVEAERLKFQAEQQRAASAEDDAHSKATYQEAAALDPDDDLGSHPGHNRDAVNEGTQSDAPETGPRPDATTARTDGSPIGDEPESTQEKRPGRRKEGL